jgi:hypothetical protein
LTTVPVVVGDESIIIVIHCTKEYVLPIGVTAAAGDNTANQTVAFVGEIQFDQLPKMWMGPATGLDDAVADSEALVPTDVQIVEFYISRGTTNMQSNDLMPRPTGATVALAQLLTRWIFIPAYFMPSFISGLTPCQA